MAVADFILVADADALLALNVNTSYGLSDTAVDLLAADHAATVGGATAVTVQVVQSVAAELAARAATGKVAVVVDSRVR